MGMMLIEYDQELNTGVINIHGEEVLFEDILDDDEELSYETKSILENAYMMSKEEVNELQEQINIIT